MGHHPSHESPWPIYKYVFHSLLKIYFGPIVRYGHVAHLGILHLMTWGGVGSLLLLEKYVLIRMDVNDGLCRLLYYFFMSGSSSFGVLGLCVKTYTMAF
jgi:hypothetical protein